MTSMADQEWREQAARIIDPHEWLALDRAARAFQNDPELLADVRRNNCKRSLAKADAILKLMGVAHVS